MGSSSEAPEGPGPTGVGAKTELPASAPTPETDGPQRKHDEADRMGERRKPEDRPRTASWHLSLLIGHHRKVHQQTMIEIRREDINRGRPTSKDLLKDPVTEGPFRAKDLRVTAEGIR